MAEIRVDFLLGPECASRAIARYGVQTGGWSHCANVLRDGRYLDARSDTLRRVDKKCNVPDVVGAGVHIRDPLSEKWVRKQRATLQVTDAEYADWEANLRLKITADYGRRDILNIILGRPGHVAGEWICSALVTNGMQHLSRSWTAPHLGFVPYPLSVAAHEISPDMAHIILETANFTFGQIEFASAQKPS